MVRVSSVFVNVCGTELGVATETLSKGSLLGQWRDTTQKLSIKKQLYLCWLHQWRSRLLLSWQPWSALCQRPVWVLVVIQSSAGLHALRWAAWATPAATPWSSGGAAGQAWCHMKRAHTVKQQEAVMYVSGLDSGIKKTGHMEIHTVSVHTACYQRFNRQYRENKTAIN